MRETVFVGLKFGHPLNGKENIMFTKLSSTFAYDGGGPRLLATFTFEKREEGWVLVNTKREAPWAEEEFDDAFVERARKAIAWP